MKIQLQGKWEPMKVAEALRDYAERYGSAWAEDCAVRIENQASKPMTKAVA